MDRTNQESNKGERITIKGNNPKQKKELLSDNLSNNENKIRTIYKDCSDVIFRSFKIGEKEQALLIYIEGMSNAEEIDKSVLAPLMEKTTEQEKNKQEMNEPGKSQQENPQNDQKGTQIDSLISQRIAVSNVKEITTIPDCIREISSGNPILLINKKSTGLSLGLSKWEMRSIEEPQAESVVRGPRDGFIETLSVNTSLIRRRIRNPKLKIVSIMIGKYTDTNVIITYIEGVAEESLIKEVKNRIQRIDIDGILSSGVVEEFIEDNPFSPFPQVLATERPDVVSSSLLEGRVAILVDGTPFAMVVPTTLYSLLQASEDYYDRFIIATAIRWLRYLFLIIAILLPSLYVAVLTFHQELLPTTLIISIATSREQVPFPALVEVLIMEIIFEALREAGIRLPKQIGSAVSIVGALVIGQAAVTAGIVSAPMVIVVAATGVASFTLPRYAAATSFRMLRFPMVILAGTLGLLGIMLGIIAIIVHLTTLRSFGTPYLSPMAPMEFKEMKDTLIRAPWWSLNTRPHLTGKYNKHRQSNNQKPSPIRGKD